MTPAGDFTALVRAMRDDSTGDRDAIFARLLIADRSYLVRLIGVAAASYAKGGLLSASDLERQAESLTDVLLQL